MAARSTVGKGRGEAAAETTATRRIQGKAAHKKRVRCCDGVPRGNNCLLLTTPIGYNTLIRGVATKKER